MDDVDHFEGGWPQVLGVLVALLSLTGASFACFFAWVTRVALCDESCHPPPAILQVQLIVALVGLIPAVAFLYASAQWRPRLALWSVVAGVAVYGAWALMNNLAVHGSLLGG